MSVKEEGTATAVVRKKSVRNIVVVALACALWLPTTSAIAVDNATASNGEIVIDAGAGSSDVDDAVDSDGSGDTGSAGEILIDNEMSDNDGVSEGDSTALPNPSPTPPLDGSTPMESELDTSEDPGKVTTGDSELTTGSTDATTGSAEVLATEIVEFKDKRLEACVTDALKIDVGKQITKDDLRRLTEFSCELSENSDIAPLAYATNLKRLNLHNSKISDISALKKLVTLESLDVSGNRISDFSALKSLTKLVHVKIGSQKPSGSLLTNRWVDVGGRWYYLNSQGQMAIGWGKIGATWYYFDSEAAMSTGWLHLGKTWYYLDASGAMATGWAKVGGAWYYMDSTGVMSTGWAAVGGKWYYFDSNGTMVTGWLARGGTWYYLNSTGAMTTGWTKVGGTWYFMNPSGAMVTGWLARGGTWYYLRPNGAMVTGWLQQGNVWYYLKSNGAMATGRHTINGVAYTFNSSGIWLSDQIPLFVYGTLRTGEEAEFVISGYVQQKIVTRASAVDLWITWDNRGSWPWIMPGTYGTTGEALSFAPQQASQAIARADNWEGYIPGGNVNTMNYTREVISSGQGYVYAYVATPHRQAFIRAYGTRVIHGDFTRF